jgi:hypothetical protein
MPCTFFAGFEQLISESISENNEQFLVLWHVVRKEVGALLTMAFRKLYGNEVGQDAGTILVLLSMLNLYYPT